MNDIPNSAAKAAQRASERIIENFKAKQSEQRTQNRHEELLQVQTDLIESNKQVASEVHGIRDSLQVQIDNNSKKIDQSDLKNEEREKRHNRQFWFTFGASLVSALATLGMFLYTVLS